METESQNTLTQGQDDENLALTPKDEQILAECWDYQAMGLSDAQVNSMSHREYLEFCKLYQKTNKMIKTGGHWFYQLSYEELESALQNIDLSAVKQMIDEMNFTETSTAMQRYNDNLLKRVAFGTLDIPDDLSLEDLKKLPKYDFDTGKFIGSKKKLRHLINVFFLPLNGRRVHRQNSIKI